MGEKQHASETDDSKRLFRVVSACILLVGLVLCAVALFRLVQDSRIEWNWEPLPIVIGVFAVLSSQVMAACAWSCHLSAFSGVRIPFRQALWQTSFMLVGKYVPGMVGGIVARVHANRKNIDSKHVLAATLVEQLGAIVAASAIGLACLVVPHSWLAGAVVLIVGSWGIYLLPGVGPPTIRRLRAFGGVFRKLPVLAPFASIHAVRLGLVFQVLHWMSLVCLTGAVVLLVASTTDVSIERVAGSYAIATVLGVLAVFAPGGLGVREASFIWLVSPDLGYETSIGVAAAMRLVMSGYDLIGFLLAGIVRVAGR